MPVLADVPDGFGGRGIPPPARARGFELALDVAEPWGGGRIAGRVEARADRADDRPFLVRAVCTAAWVDVARQLVGRSGPDLAMAYELRARGRPIWLEETVWEAVATVPPLAGANWRPFSFVVPPALPRAIEGTLCAVRYGLEARRRRRVGASTAWLPIVSVDRREEPVVRVERTPIGEWRLLEWRSPDEVDLGCGPVAILYEERAPADRPRPGEDRDAEILRRTGRVASAG